MSEVAFSPRLQHHQRDVIVLRSVLGPVISAQKELLTDIFWGDKSGVGE